MVFVSKTLVGALMDFATGRKTDKQTLDGFS